MNKWLWIRLLYLVNKNIWFEFWNMICLDFCAFVKMHQSYLFNIMYMKPSPSHTHITSQNTQIFIIYNFPARYGLSHTVSMSFTNVKSVLFFLVLLEQYASQVMLHWLQSTDVHKWFVHIGPAFHVKSPNCFAMQYLSPAWFPEHALWYSAILTFSWNLGAMIGLFLPP